MAVASTLMVLSSLTQGWAATTPLNSPRGLAIDSKGNLYVANQGGNEILVYSTSYNQQTKKSVTAGVSQPVGVAFDSKGSLYVANLGTQSTTQYSSTGVQNTKFSVTNGINSPWAITIDAADDLYVSNNFANVTAYPLDDFINGPFLLKTFTPGGAIYGIATHAGSFYVGGVNTWAGGFVGELLGGSGFSYVGSANEALALATDSAGNLWVANATGEVDLWINGGGSGFLNLSYGPAGIVVDSVRGRLYLSNQNANEIQVYSTSSGALPHTIQ